MESFFEAAINLVKSDIAIVAIVVVVAIMFAVIIMSKRKKITDSFLDNDSTDVEVKATESEDGIVISKSVKGNKDSKIKIEL